MPGKSGSLVLFAQTIAFILLVSDVQYVCIWCILCVVDKKLHVFIVVRELPY